MSAYALPGLLFPAVDQKNDDGSRSRKHKRLQHHHHGSARLEPIDTSRGESSVDTGQNKNPPTALSVKDVSIAVKDARLDPVRLVQSLSPKTSSSSGGSKRRTEQGKRSPSALHFDAVEFDLSISFNGRSYVATRSLPLLWQLRNDLIRELSSSKRKKLLDLRRRFRKEAPVEQMDFASVAGGLQKCSSHGDKVDGEAPQGDDEFEKFIPEVPDCSTAIGDHQGAGSSSRGFTMLHALVRHYSPAVEWWLGHVVELVPPMSSPALTTFLWEPLSVDAGERIGRIQTSSGLDCIQEHDDTSDCEDEDERPRSNPAA